MDLTEVYESIPNEIKWIVLTFLPMDEISKLFLIDRSFYSLSQNQIFWKEISFRDPDYLRYRKIKQKSNDQERGTEIFKEEYRHYLMNYGGIEIVKGDMKEYDLLIKTIVFGPPCGKSSLVLRFSNDTFDEGYITTIGVDFKICKFRNTRGKSVNTKAQIWDTAGQERFQTITTTYIRGSHGILLCFDLGNKESFEKVPACYKKMEPQMGENARKCIVLVGCKADLKEEEREVTENEAIELSKKLKCTTYLECSAKTGKGVNRVFFHLFRRIINQHFGENEKKDTKESHSETIVLKDTHGKRKSGKGGCIIA